MNIDVSVASVPFATEIDLDYLRSAATKGPIITLEEHSKRGGFGSIILESLHQLNVIYKLKIIALVRDIKISKKLHSRNSIIYKKFDLNIYIKNSIYF